MKFCAIYGTLKFIIVPTTAAACLYPEPDQLTPKRQTDILKIHSNVILLPKPMCSKPLSSPKPRREFPVPHTF